MNDTNTPKEPTPQSDAALGLEMILMGLLKLVDALWRMIRKPNS